MVLLTLQMCAVIPSCIATTGAVLSSDDYGSSVERTVKLHPLWHVVQVWSGQKAVRISAMVADEPIWAGAAMLH